MGGTRALRIWAAGTGLLLAFAAASAPAQADSGRWSDAKRDSININRNSDAGVGNGGEARLTESPSDNWTGTTIGEDGPYDRDPGRSNESNRAAENDDRPQSEGGGGTGVLIHPNY